MASPKVLPNKLSAKSRAAEKILRVLCLSCPIMRRNFDLLAFAWTMDLKIILWVLIDLGNFDTIADWMVKAWEMVSSISDCVAVVTIENSDCSIRKESWSCVTVHSGTVTRKVIC